jgi:hypothetical protein
MSKPFHELFVGGELAHGEWAKETGDCKTLQSPASPKDYADHLAGVRGLGLVPIRNDGTCRFAAIDIDVDSIDHQALYEKVVKRNMPVTVCRSKSGGAHIYVFIDDPGLPVEKVIATMKKWAVLLGYPRVEIFPKQRKVGKGNIGNWINLPYFDSENTVRYAVGKNGSLTLDEFLASIKFWNGKDTVDETVTKDLVQITQMPPCLATLTEEGLPEGARNSGLFNFSVYYRKSSPTVWEEKVVQHNQLYLKPPLSNREVQSIIKSVHQRKYQYLCDQEPICSRCDRKTCLTTPYGVGNEPWRDDDNFDELLVSHLRKVTSDPPRYIVEVNGQDIELATTEFLKFPKFKDRVFELLDIVVAPVSQGRWEQLIKDLLSKKTDIIAPDDASTSGMIVDRLMEFLCLSERARSLEDMLKGLPVVKDGWVWFRVSDVQRFFNHQRFFGITNQQLYSLLHKLGGDYDSVRAKGKIITAWKVPLTVLNPQSSDFDHAVFVKKEEEL